MPADGLENLCKEGFSRAIYLYSTNYETAPRSIVCRTRAGNENRLEYLQLSVLASDEEVARRILAYVHEHLQNPEAGPLYAHCWNGWHASGLVAALSFRQFCGFTAEQAVRYWNRNTDGDYEKYESVRQRIRAFRPYPDLTIPQQQKRALCPDPESLAFPHS